MERIKKLKVPAFPIQLLDSGTRDGFGAGLVAAAELYPGLVGLCADVTESVRMADFAARYPDRFVEVGVAEQNLVGVAAGMALGGKTPFAASYAVFNPGRSWDQFRVSVCYSNLNVKLVGGHAGLNVGPDGATHQALEDLALTLSLPNVTVVVPADAYEAYQATIAIAGQVGPSYLRLARDKCPDVTSKNGSFTLGKISTLDTGKDLSIVACGLLVAPAMTAAQRLRQEGLSVRVLNASTLKPFDTKTILTAARQTGAIVTAEEHQLHGGLSSLVSQTCAQHYPVPVESVAVKDTFGESGQSKELLAKYHLTTEDIQKAAWKVFNRKVKA